MVAAFGINILLQARENGFFSNSSPNMLVLGCPNPEILKVLGFTNLVICHPEKSVIKKAKELNFQTLMDRDPISRLQVLRSIGTTLVWVTKSRRETFFYIALALKITKKKGNIVVTGEKKEGIESAIKKLKVIIEPITMISKSHGKIGLFRRPLFLPETVKSWKNDGKLQRVASGYTSAAGTFSETAVDKGSRLLANQFAGKLYGKVVDLGAGWGYLSAEAIKNNPDINLMTLIDSNLGALNSARVNITSPKAKFLWLDLQHDILNLKNFDHVIMNPPFHIGRKVELGLGLTFLNVAKRILTKGGTLWMVFNKELPYEKTMSILFPNYEFLNRTKNYKVIRAKKS